MSAITYDGVTLRPIRPTAYVCTAHGLRHASQYTTVWSGVHVSLLIVNSASNFAEPLELWSDFSASGKS